MMVYGLNSFLDPCWHLAMEDHFDLRVLSPVCEYFVTSGTQRKQGK
jgi:hypothetical protein